MSAQPQDPADFAIAADALALARRRIGLDPIAAGPDWTACPAPRVGAVIEADGSVRACEYGSAPMGSLVDHAVAEVREGAAFAKLRSALAGGRLPASHCESCVWPCASGFVADAPMVRDYGALAVYPSGAGLQGLVFRLPLPGAPWSAAARRALTMESKGLSSITLEGVEPLVAANWRDAVAALRSSPNVPPISLRLFRIGDAAQAALALDGLSVADIEIDLSHGEIAELEAARRLAHSLGAPLRARFVLTPAKWFHFEAVAHACSSAPVTPLALGIQGRSPEIPLSRLSIEDLGIVRAAINSCWDRFSGTARPVAIDEGTFERLNRHLLALLQSRAEAAVSDGEEGAGLAGVSFPPLDHEWFADPARRTWWLGLLFGQGHAAAVRRWALWMLENGDADALLRSHAPFRVLCHRIALDCRCETAMAALRKTYADAKPRSALCKQDASFADGFDLTPYGGPWAQRLGLVASKPRKAPFVVGKAKAAPKKGEPDVTILIPSYRHSAFIVDAIRSVLAQDYAAIKVLVVDDRSPDDTVEKARLLTDDRLEVRVNERNLGLGNSVLAALETVTTPFVALLNSDDLFHPSRIRKCRDVFLANPEAQLVTTGLSLVDADGGELTPDNVSAVLDGRLVSDWVHWYQRVTPPEDLPQEDLFARLLESNFLAASTNLVARTDWLKRQAESLRSLKYCLDWQLFLQAALEGSLHHLHKPLAAYRLHATNTVWFHEGRRWSYYLEVNRVAAGALVGFAAHESRHGEAGVVRVLDAVASHLARNREADGLAIGLNAALGSLRLEEFAEGSEEVQRGIQQLNRSAEDTRALLDRAAQLASPVDARKQSLRSLLGQLAMEQARVERASKSWIEGYAESLEIRLRECWAGRNEIENERSRLLHEAEGLRKGAAELEQRMEQLHALEDEKLRLVGERTELQRQAVRLKADVAGLRADGEALRRDRESLRTEVESTRDENVALRADLNVVRGQREVFEREVDAARKDATVARSDASRSDEELQRERAAHSEARSQLAGSQRESAQLGAELAERGARLEALQAEGSRLAADLVSERAQKDDANRQLATTQNELSAASARLAASEHARSSKEREALMLAAEKADLERARDGLLADVVKKRDEIAALRSSREYRWGNFAWNKLPLGYVTRRGKKWYRRMLDLKNRGLMWLSRMFRRSSNASGTAVVAACWQWPIYSHTFVYQEMLGFTHMGMDLKMFHWDLGDMGQLHKAFDYLKDHRVQIQPVWETHLRDRDHFEKTKPGRLRAFLERVSKATGRSVEELEKEPIVLQGCTFARMAELAGAKYLHSYFFYDQSFMVMQAAWLLDIPRGVSCYADHMLDDYPWKLVPLQVELASVVVATSARIKRELSAKSGGKFDDKIIVKPNGVDGARFAAFDRPLRKQDEPFEVISISRVEPKKGLTHLVEAVALLKQQGIKVIAHVVGSKDLHSKGSAEYAELFDRRIQELGVADCVIQHGMMKQEDLAPILKKCRAFVAPYVELGSGDKDGIPTAMLEGLASGLPVVTTDSGSILEVVDNGVEGIVVNQRDSKAFAEALHKLVRDPELERRMSKAARARFDKEFDIRVTEKRLHERVAALVAKVGKKR